MEELAFEIRNYLIGMVSVTGGHIASNLGVVELTLALHKIFTTPKDKIIWDVGHQSYVHKILTGRKEKFDTLRKFGGLAGFPKTCESEHDCFNTGHSSTSISAGLGIARARDIVGGKYSVISVIGDGALTGGISFEALNDAGRSKTNFIVVLNDNEMSISKNVGGLSGYLSKIRTEPIYSKAKEDVDSILDRLPIIGKGIIKILHRIKGTIKYIIMPGVIFEELGFTYLGPIDGHDIQKITDVLSRAKKLKGPVLIHVCTQKGKGYYFAEKNPGEYHGISPFEVETGEVKNHNGPGYSDIFGEELMKLAEDNKDITAITAAMPHGTGLQPFSKKFSKRFYDVGIAEQHAVTLAAGMASNGLKPVVAVYSTFLQRAYDQILHDISIQNLHVIFAIDRAGIVGEDGETHHGIYDISYLRHMPNITMLAPADYGELRTMLNYAVLVHKGPISIRYPKGIGCESISRAPIEYGKGVIIKEGKDLTLIPLGNMVSVALEVSKTLESLDIYAEIINPRFIKPLDKELILNSARKTGRLIIIEDGIKTGGFGSSIIELINEYEASENTGSKSIKVKNFGFPEQPIPHGSRRDIYKKYGLDADSIVKSITDELKISST